jgi:methyl-accepting chemotaxis protein
VNAGRLEIDLVAGIARLQQDMQTATGIIRQGASTIDSILSKVGAGLTVGAITLFAKHTVDAIAKMKDLGLEVGTSAEAMSRFEAPTRSAGLSLDDTATAMFRMSKAALEAKDPTSKAAQALQAIGISTNQLKGLKADEMFELVARQIAKYSDGISKNNVMMELFSKSGREMNRVVAEIAETEKLTPRSPKSRPCRRRSSATRCSS